MPDSLSGTTLVIATGHALSLALFSNGELLAETVQDIERGHAEAIVPAIARMLLPFGGADCHCDQIVAEVGPGSFTGLRVGIAAAKGLAVAWQARVHGVRSTQLVAADARRKGAGGPLFVALAAPRGQIWVERFGRDGLESLGLPVAVSAAQCRGLVQTTDTIIGTAAPLLGGSGMTDGPRAAALPGLAYGGLMEAEPLYVRSGEMDASRQPG